MRFIFSLLLVILNLVNIPLSMLYMRVQKWYLPMWEKDKVIYIAFAPFYWILVALTFIFGWPVEQLSKIMH